MKSFATLAVAFLLGSSAMAAKSATVTCTSQSKEAVLTIQKIGGDAKGDLFQGVIYKNGKVLRNTVQRAFEKNGEVTIYTDATDAGWKFRASTNGSTTMGFVQSKSMYGTLEKELGRGNNILYCNHSL